jgi:hypothetical protein
MSCNLPGLGSKPDKHHANRRYGVQMLKQILAYLDSKYGTRDDGQLTGGSADAPQQERLSAVAD